MSADVKSDQTKAMRGEILRLARGIELPDDAQLAESEMFTPASSDQTTVPAEIIGSLVTAAYEAVTKAEAAVEIAHKTAKMLNHESAGHLYWATVELMDAKHRLDAAYRKDCV